MRPIITLATGLVLAAGLALGGCAQEGAKSASGPMTITMPISPGQEVPPVQSKASGSAVVTLDPAKKTIAWKITWENTSGDVVAAHLHGPAAPGANAGVVIPLGQGSPLKQPLEGTATLSDAQWADLAAGKDYINLHTAANKGGELRGQVPGK